MDIILDTATWVPVLLVLTSDGYTPKTGLVFNSDGLTVKYKSADGAVVELALTSENWREATLGAYEVLLPTEAFFELGVTLYWVEATDAVTYQGALTVVASVVEDSGLLPWTVTINKSDGTPDPAAQVWLTSDEVGTLPALRATKTTDDTGQVTFHLDAGVHYWVQSLGSDGEEGTPVEIVGV